MEYSKLIESLNAFKNFKNSLMADSLSQAYLFVCEDKLTLNLFLKRLQLLLACESSIPCEKCTNCIKVLAGSHPDVLIYPKSKNFVVADASEIYDTIQVKPMLLNKKTYVIENIDNATEQAQNKMLKVIEEPPTGVIFLLSASNENKVLKTITSRVQKIHLDKLNKNLLQQTLNLNENIKDIAISGGDGFLGKTLNIAQNEEYLNLYHNIKNLIINFKNSTQIPVFSKFLNENNAIFENSLYLLNDFFRDLLMINLNQTSLIKNENLTLELKNIAKEYSIIAIIKILKSLSEYKKRLNSNVNLSILADNLLLEILEVKFLWK